MPDRIDPTTGLRIDDDRRTNSPAELAHVFTREIEALKATHGEVPNSQYVVVEKGDCLWDIAEEYGVDPQTLIRDNKQFADNPDLIYPGEIVIVRLPDANQNPQASGTSFGQQLQSRSQSIDTSPSTDSQVTHADEQWGELRLDSKTFFSGITDKENKDEALAAILTTTTGRARTEAINGYLDSLGPNERAAGIAALRTQYAGNAEVLGDIPTA